MTEPRKPTSAPGVLPSDESDHRVRVALLGTVVLAVVWNLVGNLVLPGAWYVPANLVAAATFVLLARWAGLTTIELGISRRHLVRGALVGLLAAVVIGVVLAVALVIPAAESALEDDGVAADGTGTRWFMALIRIPLGTALFEEVLFRSVLFGLVMRLRTQRFAIIATSVLFGLWHIAPAWDTSAETTALAGTVVGTVLVTTIGGVLFALLRVWSRSVLAPVLAHWATNSLAYAAAIIALDVID